MLNRLFNSRDDAASESKLRLVHDEDEHQERDVHEENRLLRAVIDNFPGGLSLFDRNLKLVFCNEQQKKLLDYPPELFEFGDPSLEQLFRFNATRGEYGPGDIEKHVADRMALVRQRCAHVFERQRPNGRILEIRGVPLEGGGFLTTYLDVTEQRHAAKEAAHNAGYDKLTGLIKGVLFQDRVGQLLARVRRGQVAAIHCMDLDHFKNINATYSRTTGDLLLRMVAVRLQGAVRGSDTVARIGGDRFVVLQPDVTRPSDVAKMATRLLDAVRQPYEIGSQPITLSTSIGLALAPRDGLDYETLMAKAVAAVMHTKSRNRGSFEAETIDWS